MGCASSTTISSSTTSPHTLLTPQQTSPNDAITQIWFCPLCNRQNVRRVECQGCEFSLVAENLPTTPEEEEEGEVVVEKNIALEKTHGTLSALADQVLPSRYWLCRACTYENTIVNSGDLRLTSECDMCGGARGPEDLTKLRSSSESRDDGRSKEVANGDSREVDAVPESSSSSSSLPALPLDSYYFSKDESQAIDEAIFSVECPVCLEVYRSPRTLPCGHSLCKEHVTEMGNKCPVCRKEFNLSMIEKRRSSCVGETNSDEYTSSYDEDKELEANIETIVRMVSTIDPTRETIRIALERLKLSTPGVVTEPL